MTETMSSGCHLGRPPIQRGISSAACLAPSGRRVGTQAKSTRKAVGAGSLIEMYTRHPAGAEAGEPRWGQRFAQNSRCTASASSAMSGIGPITLMPF